MTEKQLPSSIAKHGIVWQALAQLKGRGGGGGLKCAGLRVERKERRGDLGVGEVGGLKRGEASDNHYHP